MSPRPYGQRRLAWRLAGFFLLASLWPAAAARAQTGTPPEPPPQKLAVTGEVPPVPPAQDDGAVADPNVVQAQCATCGGGLLGAAAPPPLEGYGPAGCSTCGGGDGDCGKGCYPGRKTCYCADCSQCDTCIGRLFCGVYNCICCPDPCYEPRWIAAQDSAFFVESARPITQLRIRGEGGFDVDKPDRAEYFWARERTMPNQLEPGPVDPKAPGFDCFRHGFGKGPACIAQEIDYEDLSLYMEGAIDRFGFFVELPYREVDPQTAPASIMEVNAPLPPGTPSEMAGGRSPLNNMPLAPNTPLPTDIRVGNAGATISAFPGQATTSTSMTTNASPPTTPPAGPATTTTSTRTLTPGTILRKGQTFPGYLTLGGDSVVLVPTPTHTNLLPAPCCNASGFSDMNIGTKSVLLDCELLLLTFQFKTYIPTGDFTKGLGNGHVSLEPAMLFALKLSHDFYLQGEFAYWIPIGGDNLYQGDVFHEHFSFNKTLWCPCPGVKFVGTIEASHWAILGGDYTVTDFLLPDPRPGPNHGHLAPVAVSASEFSSLLVGPGIRMVLCDKIDLGVGSQFAVTGDAWAEEIVRAEFRWRF